MRIRIKEDAMGAYFMMFATAAMGLPLPILNLVAAIIYYYVNRDALLYKSGDEFKTRPIDLDWDEIKAGL